MKCWLPPGRYRPGKDKPDPKTWKANFRCALNSLPDICELREYSRKRGSNAYRVYRMLPSTQTLRRRKGSAGASLGRTSTVGPVVMPVCPPHRSGLRLFNRSRERHTSLGDDTWPPTAAVASDAPQKLEAAAEDALSGSQTHGGRFAVALGADGGRQSCAESDVLLCRDVGGETRGAGAE